MSVSSEKERSIRMTRWEYLYFTDAERETSTLHPPGHKEKLNELGKDGWELVSVVFDREGRVQKLYFKRQIVS
jgi:hypothetical protein